MPAVITTPPTIGNIRYRPVLVIARPTTSETTSMPNISGSSSRPLLVAEAPCTVCW